MQIFVYSSSTLLSSSKCIDKFLFKIKMGCFISLLRHSKSPFKRCFSRRRGSIPIYFEGPARRQDFALPNPIMYYIAKNASSANAYRKLVKSCKYFFIKNPIIVIPCLHYNKSGWSTCLIDKKGIEKFDMEKISKKLWLCDKFLSHCDLIESNDGPFTPFSPKSLFHKFYRIESSALRWNNMTTTFEEVVFFGSPSAKKLYLYNCIVQYENGESVQLETLIAQFPLLQGFFYKCHPDGSNVSVNTVKEILSNPTLSKMEAFHLLEIPDTFDIESFYTYLKNRNDFYCLLNFRDDISADYYERLLVIVDELLSTESTSFRFPGFWIPNLHPETHNALRKRVDKAVGRKNFRGGHFHFRGGTPLIFCRLNTAAAKDQRGFHSFGGGHVPQMPPPLYGLAC